VDSWYKGPECQGTCAGDYKPPPPKRRSFFGLFGLSNDIEAIPRSTRRQSSSNLLALGAGLAALLAIFVWHKLKTRARQHVAYTQV